MREIELEENLKRKDLTDFEKSKNMVELAEIKAEIKREGTRELRPESGRKQGRPTKPDSIREKAKDIGVPSQTLHQAQQHVAAVEKYPELKHTSKSKIVFNYF